MKRKRVKPRHKALKEGSISEILILPDGRIFAHNISTVMAEVLGELNPADEVMRQRARPKANIKNEI